MNRDQDMKLGQLASKLGRPTEEQFDVAPEKSPKVESGTVFDTLLNGASIGQAERALLRTDLTDDRDQTIGGNRDATDVTLEGESVRVASPLEEAANTMETIVHTDTSSFRKQAESLSNLPTLPPSDELGSMVTFDVPSGIIHHDGAKVYAFDDQISLDTIVDSSTSNLPHVRLKTISDDGGSSRYTRTKKHAEGGLGVVWSAQDRAVGREVALKELRVERGSDPRILAKFMEEARITGQLEHPSIVPVYEVAQDPETGKPFYTMRFIKGVTLAEACSQYRRNCREGHDDPLAFRSLLTAFLGVCQAVAYAHSRGVIHRDLKGQNVVLGDFGEAIVLDWGLAKIIDGPQGEEEVPVVATCDDERSALETREGQISGTPTYMAPEQALGNISQVDRRSDIYSLGAILYEIICGKPPFTGSSTADLLNRVKRGELVAPRLVLPTVPKALEAICLKAMALNRDDRYQSAAELAREVDRYLADEPVLAFPEPWTTRASRWARKHRTAVAAAAILLVASVLGLTVGNILIGQERDRVRVQREIARQAVDNMYTDVAEQWLEDQSDPLQQKFADRALVAYEKRAADQPVEPVAADLEKAEPATSRADRIDAVQKSFLERSLAYYGDFAKQQPEGVQSALDVAQARVRMANIERKLGKLAEAERTYRQATNELADLASRRANDLDIKRALAVARGRFGSMLVTEGKFDEADEMLAKSEAGLVAVVESPSVLDRDRLELGRVLRERAERLKLAGKTEEAESQFRKAIANLATLTKGKRGGLEARHELALAEDALGVMLLLSLDRQAEAATLLQDAMKIQEQLVKETPTVPHLRAGLGKTGNTLGLILRSDGKTNEAIKATDLSLANYQRLADDFPGRHEYQRALARAFLNRGSLDQDDGRVAEAAVLYEKAVGLLTNLVAQAPEITKHHRDLGIALNNLAAMRERQEIIDVAVATYKRSEEIDRKLAERFPTVPDYKEILASHQLNLARALVKTGQPADGEEAVKLAQSALLMLQGLVKSHPQVTAYGRGVAESQSQIGQIYLMTGRGNEAEPFLRQAVSGFRTLVKKNPRAVGTRRSLIDTLVNLGEAASADSEKADREALAQVEEICKSPKATSRDRYTRAVVHNNLGEILEKKGETAEADKLYARAETLFNEKGLDGGEPQRLHLLSYVLTNRGKLAQTEKRLDNALTYFREAVDRDKDATKLLANYKSFLLDDYNRLGALLIERGDHRAASLLAFEIVKTLPEVSASRVAAASLLSRCMDLARKDDQGKESDRTALAKSYATKGIAQLRVVLDSGFKRLDSLKGDAHIQNLLNEPESREVLPDLMTSKEITGA